MLIIWGGLCTFVLGLFHNKHDGHEAESKTIAKHCSATLPQPCSLCCSYIVAVSMSIFEVGYAYSQKNDFYLKYNSYLDTYVFLLQSMRSFVGHLRLNLDCFSSRSLRQRF